MNKDSEPLADNIHVRGIASTSRSDTASPAATASSRAASSRNGSGPSQESKEVVVEALRQYLEEIESEKRVREAVIELHLGEQIEFEKLVEIVGRQDAESVRASKGVSIVVRSLHAVGLAASDATEQNDTESNTADATVATPVAVEAKRKMLNLTDQRSSSGDGGEKRRTPPQSPEYRPLCGM